MELRRVNEILKVASASSREARPLTATLIAFIDENKHLWGRSDLPGPAGRSQHQSGS